MNDNIQNRIATIHSVEDTGTQVKLKDANKRSLGSFFKVKKDGNLTQAYEQFQNMEIKSGETVEISFKETPDKNDPKIVYKNIIGFREAAGRPEPRQTQNSAPQRVFTGNDDYGRRLALHGFINARLVNNTISQVELEIDHLLKLEDKIESKLNIQRSDDAPLPEPPPENIPF